ncbi:MAG: hypothetical protein K8U57_07270 [Planctomycetes bacterium]|nr:hypothetical protein [Planctomycetota bacterium]
MNASLVSAPSAEIEHTQADFVDALTRILRIARFRFRHLRCSDSREDAICETVALCWVWYTSLVRKGRKPAEFIGALARYGVRAVSSGRRACGQERANDVLSRRCQRGRQLCVSSLPKVFIPHENVFEEALCDNTQTPVPDQVQFRCDFAAWEQRLPLAKQRLVKGLALGHRTKDLAAEFELSEARISQLRKEFSADYTAFCGDSTTA